MVRQWLPLGFMLNEYGSSSQGIASSEEFQLQVFCDIKSNKVSRLFFRRYIRSAYLLSLSDYPLVLLAHCTTHRADVLPLLFFSLSAFVTLLFLASGWAAITPF